MNALTAVKKIIRTSIHKHLYVSCQYFLQENVSRTQNPNKQETEILNVGQKSKPLYE